MPEGFAPARTALAGNPSDGYGGAVLAVTLPGLGARARAVVGDRLSVTPESRLVRATAARIGATASIEWSTNVPTSVGLGGSSAIAIAVLRALDPGLPPEELAVTALAVEREDLGIPGGRQDQVVQAHGGLVLMDFSGESDVHVERLDHDLLPPLVVAWRETKRESSGIAHAALRSRYSRGDMPALARLAHEAAAALRAGDRAGFAQAVEESYRHRAAMVSLQPGHVEMIETAQAAGAAANYSGSGGAIVAVCEDPRHRDRVTAALRELGCGVLSAPA